MNPFLAVPMQMRSGGRRADLLASGYFFTYYSRLMPRDDFNSKIRDSLAHRVGMVCSNPNCARSTSGPRSESDKSINIGVAAHITAASANGPRYDASLSKQQRQCAENGIWLCQTCAKLIDNDIATHTVQVLREWKQIAEENARNAIHSPMNSSKLLRPATADDAEKHRRTLELVQAELQIVISNLDVMTWSLEKPRKLQPRPVPTMALESLISNPNCAELISVHQHLWLVNSLKVIQSNAENGNLETITILSARTEVVNLLAGVQKLLLEANQSVKTKRILERLD